MQPESYTLNVPLGERSYDIEIGAGLIHDIAHHIDTVLHQPRVIVVSDEAVSERYLSEIHASFDSVAIKHDAIIVPPGEGSKSFTQFEKLMNDLLALKPDRKTMLIALGGGVVGDLCGFAAATLLRGVDFIQVPTTLLAQVDSSVGGKTGINASAGKNLIGAFHQPRKVMIDLNTLSTLPKRELLAGYAEIVKYGLIGDEGFYQWLKSHAEDIIALQTQPLAQAIYSSCRAKADVVARDEKEGGVRALLNFGHTFGHALEAEMGYDGRLLHGEAVAIGMVMAADLSVKMGNIDPSVKEDIKAHLSAVGLPVSPLDIAKEWDAEAMCQHFLSDKKTEAGELTFVVLQKVGLATVQKGVSYDLAKQVVEESLQ